MVARFSWLRSKYRDSTALVITTYCAFHIVIVTICFAVVVEHTLVISPANWSGGTREVETLVIIASKGLSQATWRDSWAVTLFILGILETIPRLRRVNQTVFTATTFAHRNKSIRGFAKIPTPLYFPLWWYTDIRPPYCEVTRWWLTRFVSLFSGYTRSRSIYFMDFNGDESYRRAPIFSLKRPTLRESRTSIKKK